MTMESVSDAAPFNRSVFGLRKRITKASEKMLAAKHYQRSKVGLLRRLGETIAEKKAELESAVWFLLSVLFTILMEVTDDGANKVQPVATDEEQLSKYSRRLLLVAACGLGFVALSPISTAMRQRVVSMNKNWQDNRLRSFLELSVWLRAMFQTNRATQSLTYSVVIGTIAGAIVVEIGSKVSDRLTQLSKVVKDFMIDFDSKKKPPRTSSFDDAASVKSVEGDNEEESEEDIAAAFSDPMLIGCAALFLFGGALSHINMREGQEISLTIIVWVFTNALFVSAGHILTTVKSTRWVGNVVLDRVINTFHNWKVYTMRSSIETMSYVVSILIAYVMTGNILHSGVVGSFTGVAVCSVTETFNERDGGRYLKVIGTGEWDKKNVIFLLASSWGCALLLVGILAVTRNPVISVLAASGIFSAVYFFLGHLGQKADKEEHVSESRPDQVPAPQWSSGVLFHPPSNKYWRIGGEWYDLSKFLDTHPGGRKVLEVSRDRFEDCTYVFEANHHNYKRARAVIRKYKITDKETLKSIQEGLDWQKAQKLSSVAPDRENIPAQLLDDTAFYSVFRARVTKHLKDIGCPKGLPTTQALVFFWVVFISWCAVWAHTLWSGSFASAVLLGFVAAILGAFGHSFVHCPQYRWLAYLSLDTLGFSSDMWERDHNLQHHMYTNTPWDNHFKGTDPFLITDPTVERTFLQTWITPYLNPIVLCFGVLGNFCLHTTELFKGNETFRMWKLVFPLEVAAFVIRWGVVRGGLLVFVHCATLGVYYFTMALMNHNSEHCQTVEARNEARDFGEAQLASCQDWACNWSFLSASVFLWLNYHTVHHLLPRVDASHHPAIQQILIDTCKEFGITYKTGTFRSIYKEMVQSFASPRSLFQEVLVYGAGK